MKTSQMADKILIALVRVFDDSPAILTEPGFGMDIFDLAAKAKIMDKKGVEKRRQNYFSGGMDSLPDTLTLLKRRGWVETYEMGEYGKYSQALYPTPTGIDHGHWLMRPWYKKIAGYLSRYVIQITVSVITAAVTTLVTYFIIEWIR